MQDKRINRRQVLQGIGALGVAGALSDPATVFADDAGGRRARWDIITPAVTVTPGGQLSAKASDGSMITMMGSGTFIAPGSDAVTGAVTGGGTWMTSDPTGAATGSGTYRVTRLVSFLKAPGALPPGSPDLIGSAADAFAGLAVFKIAYSNGSTGTLVFSCMLPGSPSSILEGITATMGFVDYWNSMEAPQTIFHAVR
jgi:hypothetical protein